MKGWSLPGKLPGDVWGTARQEEGGQADLRTTVGEKVLRSAEGTCFHQGTHNSSEYSKEK